MGIDQTMIDEIVRRVSNVAPAERVIVFGSATTGQMTPDSDVDLLVVQADPGDRRKESVRIHSTLR